jgi:hypothetical protein
MRKKFYSGKIKCGIIDRAPINLPNDARSGLCWLFSDQIPKKRNKHQIFILPKGEI